MRGSRAVLAVVPNVDSMRGDSMFDPDCPANRDDVLRLARELRKMGRERDIAVHTIDMAPDADVIVSTDLILEDVRAPWMCYVSEPPVTRPDLYRRFDELRAKAALVFTHSPKLAAVGGNVRPFSVPQVPPLQVGDGAGEGPRSFMAMVNANKRPYAFRHELYTKRLRVAAWLAKRDVLDVYGPGWERTVKMYPLWTRAVRRRWKGLVESKHELLKRYDFCLAFENSSFPGYITEKLFDPMWVGCIPIYLGDPGIADAVPDHAYIDFRNFGSPRRLLRALLAMSPEEKASIRAAMNAYLASPEFDSRFSMRAYVSQMLDASEELLSARHQVV